MILLTTEWLLPGKLGHLAVVTAFIAAILSAISYFIATRKDNAEDKASWIKFGRMNFHINGILFLFIIVLLYTLLISHRFEYYYVWRHSSTTLPFKYLISCFWEGSEGSFLLWAFWNVVLAFFLLKKTAKKWEPYLFSVFSLLQAFLASMLLGFKLPGGSAIGSSPFILFKDAMPDIPLVQFPNYLEMLGDGNGLNPLLQNDWMVIHPPTLFLGFAATVIPFLFTIAALWTKDWKGFGKEALSWTLFAGGILGLGILMGGWWAYEALTFGGFWAWDPVENAILIPWMTLVAGLHTLLIYRATGYSLRTTFLMFLLTFGLVLYSTFLTKSGVLSESSVHSFTDLGMSGQLLIFLIAFVLIGLILLVVRWKSVPKKPGEEATWSREFWMFIGGILLFLASLQVLFDTSREVINLVIGTNLAPPEDPANYYTNIQIWAAIVIAFFTGMVQYMRYGKTETKKLFKKLMWPLFLALPLSITLYFILEINGFQYGLILFTSLFALLANLFYIITAVKGKLNLSGASISHIGFALILIGTLISNHKKQVLRTDQVDYLVEDRGVDDQNKGANLLLFKDIPVTLGDYVLTYKGDSLVEPNTYYEITYEKKSDDGQVLEAFTLYPNSQYNPKMGGLIASPATRHYLFRDVYTHVTSTLDKNARDKKIDEEQTKIFEIAIGDTFKTEMFEAYIPHIQPNPENPKYLPQEGDIAVSTPIQIFTLTNKIYEAEPIYYIRDNVSYSIESEVNNIGYKFILDRILPEEQKVRIIAQKYTPDWITLKAIVFPYINILWLGVLTMTIGFLMSMFRRIKEKKGAK